MIAYYFRQIENGKPTGWIGFVVAPDLKNLFWMVDEFLDPYSVEIKTANSGGYCKFWDVDREESSNYENSEFQPYPDESGWRKPKWNEDWKKND